MIARPRLRRTVSQSNRGLLIGLGIAGTAASILALYIGIEAPNSLPLQSHYTLHVYFRSADNLVDHNQVRLGGTDVGQVLNPRASHGMALVDLQLSTSVEPLHGGTTFRVRPRSPIGEQFVEIFPSVKGQPIPNGATIPASQTSGAVPYDVAFDILGSRRRAEMQTVLRELGSGIAAEGSNLNQAIQATPSFLTDAGTVAGAINRRSGAATRLISSTAAAMGAFAPVRAEMASGFAPEAHALQPLIDHAGNVRATLDDAPPALTAASTQLAAVDALLSQVDAMTVAARVALAPAPDALSATNGMLRTSRPGLHAAVPTLRRLANAVTPVLRLLGTVKPVLPNLGQTLQDSVPTLQYMANRGCDIKDFLYNWAESTSLGDSGGEVLRLVVAHPSVVQLQGGYSSEPLTLGTGGDPYPAPCAAPKEFAER